MPPSTPAPDGRRFRTRLVALLLTLVTGLAVTVAVVDDDGPGGAPPRIEVKVTKVDADADGRRDDRLTVEPKAAAALGRAVAATTPEGEPKSELAEPLREPKDPSRSPAGVVEGPLAAGDFPGCRTRFVSNYSSRNGATVGAIGLHQTVSRANGWASQNALTAYANRIANGVSWHLLIAPVTGYCTYTVPLHMKAWTQGNANPVMVGIEVERYGDERTYVEGAGRRKLVAALREIGRRFNIPMRRGKVTFDSRCRPTVVRRGIVDHKDLGRCGGGHSDVKPWSTSPIIAEAARPSATDRAAAKTCRQLKYHRAKFPRERPGTKAWQKRRDRIVTLKARAATQGVDERRCRP